MDRRAFLTGSAAIAAAAAPGCGQAPARNSAPSKTSTPTSGLDAAMLDATLARAAELPRLHAMVVARNGRTFAEQAFRGPSLDAPVNIKSASKSVLAAVTGAAVGAGVLTGVDQHVLPLLRDHRPANPDPRLEALTVDHLLSMRAGLQSTSGPNYGQWVESSDWTRHALAQPFVDQPGGRMIYSTGTSHLLSASLTQAAGRSTLELTREWLGEPLDLEVPAWPQAPEGVFFGGNDMRLSPRALLRFGELYRLGGEWRGRRVLPDGWVEQSWRGRGRSRWSGNPYGYGWWIKETRGRPVYFAWGYGGQMVFVDPALALTAVMTSDPTPVATRGDHVQRLHALFDDGLVPAAEAGASPG